MIFTCLQVCHWLWEAAIWEGDWPIGPVLNKVAAVQANETAAPHHRSVPQEGHSPRAVQGVGESMDVAGGSEVPEPGPQGSQHDERSVPACRAMYNIKQWFPLCLLRGKLRV